MSDIKLNILLSVPEINAIIDVLKKRPYEEIADVLDNLKFQAQTELDKARAVKE